MNFTLLEMKFSRRRNMHLFQVVLEVRWLVLQRKKVQSINSKGDQGCGGGNMTIKIRWLRQAPSKFNL